MKSSRIIIFTRSNSPTVFSASLIKIRGALFTAVTMHLETKRRQQEWSLKGIAKLALLKVHLHHSTDSDHYCDYGDQQVPSVLIGISNYITQRDPHI